MTGPGGTGKTRLALQAAAEASGDVSRRHLVGRARAASRRPAARHRRWRRRSWSKSVQTATSPSSSSRNSRASVRWSSLDNVEHLLPEVATRDRARFATSRVQRCSSPAGSGSSSRVSTSIRCRRLQTTMASSSSSCRARALASDVERVGRDRRALHAPGQPSACARAGGGAHGRVLRRSSSWRGSRSGSTCSRPVGTPIRASRRCERRSSGRTTCSRRRSRGCFAGSPCSPADAHTRRRRSSCGADPDTIQSLLDKSLLRRSEDDAPRYWMLETIRELAAERLVSEGEDAAVRRTHAEHYLTVARSSNLDAEAPGPAAARRRYPGARQHARGTRVGGRCRRA